MASLYALDESNGFALLMEVVPDKAGYRFAVVSIFISWSIFAVWVVGKIQDPKKKYLPHSGFMVPAAIELINNYEDYRRDVILARYDKAGELGFLGGWGAKEFEISRFSVLNVREHAENHIKEIERLESVRGGDKLRVIYYSIEGGVDRVELLARKVDRFLRSKGVDPEEVAPSRPLPD
ncbi:hypothetical protein GCM10007147_46040 [Nocardiopsis kunsanensis]|uniref:Uncharacterized protein n=2 Tax=Nocardiopsis kunsanensis TaxID=141693 RepID=A0A918XMJ7_9ACTN|nr:hypothetical protein GCM10007147_46040 [Nocardiopsis kunsanensis]